MIDVAQAIFCLPYWNGISYAGSWQSSVTSCHLKSKICLLVVALFDKLYYLTSNNVFALQSLWVSTWHGSLVLALFFRKFCVKRTNHSIINNWCWFFWVRRFEWNPRCICEFDSRARRVEMRLINFDRTSTHVVSCPRLITDTSVVTVIGMKPSAAIKTHPASEWGELRLCRFFPTAFLLWNNISPWDGRIYF